MATGLTPVWLDSDCFFARGVLEAQLKQMLPPDAVMENGFVCSSSNFNNADLASIFTSLIGLNTKAIDEAPCNEDFFNAMWDAFLCQRISDRKFSGVSTGGNVSIALPAGGSWLTHVVIVTNEATHRGLYSNGIIIADDGDDVRLATTAQVYAGGTVLTATSSSTAEAMTMSVTAERIDCL